MKGEMFYNKKVTIIAVIALFFCAFGLNAFGFETEENNHWNVNMNDFTYTMTMMAKVRINDVEVYSTEYELGVFVNDTCRGSVRLIYVDPIDSYLAFITIGGEGGEEMTYKLYDVAADVELDDTDDTCVFAADQMLGSFEAPVVVSFRKSTLSTSFNETGGISVYPNPCVVGGQIVVEMPAEENADSYVEILDMTGRVVSRHYSNNVTAPENAGIYILKTKYHSIHLIITL